MPGKNEKHRRMAIRRDIGNRKLTKGPPADASLHPPYLVAHVCFNCQKSLKLTPEHDHLCPECGGRVYSMGRAFKTPKRSDKEQWCKVQMLYALGFRFHRYGGDYEPLPRRLREVESFVERNPNHKLRVAEPELSLMPVQR